VTSTLTDPTAGTQSLLAVEDLRAYFNTDDGVVRAVDGVDFEIRRGEVFAVVGESGSGKSVTAMTIMGLVPTISIESGAIRWKGRDLLTMSEEERRTIRGGEIAMIFQDPLTALNPVHTVGRQIGEMARIHEGLGKREARQRAIEMLNLVGIPEARKRADMYPHEFSGGMRQRAMIAMAITCKPDLLIADEPTTALDATIQAQILDLLVQLRSETGMALVFISHDLGAVSQACERVCVMYAGRIVEEGTVDQLFSQPRHPYTRGLFDAIPRLDGPRQRLVPIPGTVPNPKELPKGCAFSPRCARATQFCLANRPRLLLQPDGRSLACVSPIDPRDGAGQTRILEEAIQ